MNQREIKKAIKLLGDRIERSEVMSTGSKKLCLSVQFVGGWSKIFYSLESVEAWLECHTLPYWKEESQLIPSDGFADGGCEYTDEELNS